MTTPPADTMPDTSPGPPTGTPPAPAPPSALSPAHPDFRAMTARRTAALLDRGHEERLKFLAAARELVAAGKPPSTLRIAEQFGTTVGRVENCLRTVKRHPERYPDGWPAAPSGAKAKAKVKPAMPRPVDPDPIPLPAHDRPAPRLIPARVGVTVAFLATPGPAVEYVSSTLATPVPPDLLATLGGPGAWMPYPEPAVEPSRDDWATRIVDAAKLFGTLWAPLFTDDEIEALRKFAEKPDPAPASVAPEPAPCPSPTPAAGTASCATASALAPGTIPTPSGAPSTISAGSTGRRPFAPTATGDSTAMGASRASTSAPTPMGGEIPAAAVEAEGDGGGVAVAEVAGDPGPSPYIIHDFLPDPVPDLPAARPPKAKATAPPRPKAPPRAPRPAPRPPALSPAAREILADLPAMGSPGTFRFPKGAEDAGAAKVARPAVVELELTPVEKARRDAANATDDKSRLLSLAWNIRDAGRFPTDLELSRRLNVSFADVVRMADALSDEGLWVLTRRRTNRPLADLGIPAVGGPSPGKGGEHA
jgi:hypothetical protein